MIKNISHILLWVFFAAIQLQLIAIYTQPKDVVIDVEAVFNGFEMKKELASGVQSIEMRQNHIMDSLKLVLKGFERQYENAVDRQEKEDINQQHAQLANHTEQRRQYMQQQLQQAIENYDTQIWNQLNGYLKEYGQKYNCRMVLGNYQKNVVFNQTEIDKTKEVIQFINHKYQGNS